MPVGASTSGLVGTPIVQVAGGAWSVPAHEADTRHFAPERHGGAAIVTLDRRKKKGGGGKRRRYQAPRGSAVIMLVPYLLQPPVTLKR